MARVLDGRAGCGRFRRLCAAAGFVDVEGARVINVRSAPPDGSNSRCFRLGSSSRRPPNSSSLRLADRISDDLTRRAVWDVRDATEDRRGHTKSNEGALADTEQRGLLLTRHEAVTIRERDRRPHLALARTAAFGFGRWNLGDRERSGLWHGCTSSRCSGKQKKPQEQPV
jgi:hypothetical protein